MKNESVLVIFGEKIPRKSQRWWKQFDEIIAPKKLEPMVKGHGLAFIDIETLIEPGSIYEASAFLEELSYLKLADGSRLAKSFDYKGYELWWMYYNNLFHYFCLPYTQYKKLLEHLKGFQSVYLCQPPYGSFFSCYLEAYGCKVNMLRRSGLKSPSALPFGVLIQIILTSLSLPILMLSKRPAMVFTGDKFEKDRDYDFRMRFIYEELRQRKIPFVEFIRSLESWKKVLNHAFTRKRPVIYSEGVAFVGRFASFLSGGHAKTRRRFGAGVFFGETDPEKRFRLLIATRYLLGVYDDIWAIRIMKWILRIIGVRAAFAAAAMERNYHAILGCKLNGIPTVGILHGVASRHYNVYEFTPGFDGDKSMSVDRYGVWSEWWKDYFTEHGRAYKPEQLFVSGPMRPLSRSNLSVHVQESQRDAVKVLFISEEVSVPREIMPYLDELLAQKDIDLTIKFRPYRDGFEDWLLKNNPGIMKSDRIKIVKGSMQDAVKDCDVTVGSYSTAVLEALVQIKPPIFCRTLKWGDYYDLKDYDEKHSFFAENPRELVEKIKKVRSVPAGVLKNLQERYFGDPYKNGSKWVVDQMEDMINRGLN